MTPPTWLDAQGRPLALARLMIRRLATRGRVSCAALLCAMLGLLVLGCFHPPIPPPLPAPVRARVRSVSIAREFEPWPYKVCLNCASSNRPYMEAMIPEIKNALREEFERRIQEAGLFQVVSEGADGEFQLLLGQVG